MLILFCTGYFPFCQSCFLSFFQKYNLGKQNRTARSDSPVYRISILFCNGYPVLLIFLLSIVLGGKSQGKIIERISGPQLNGLVTNTLRGTIRKLHALGPVILHHAAQNGSQNQRRLRDFIFVKAVAHESKNTITATLKILLLTAKAPVTHNTRTMPLKIFRFRAQYGRASTFTVVNRQRKHNDIRHDRGSPGE